MYLTNERTKTLIQSAAYGPKNSGNLAIENPIVLQYGKGICGYVAESGVSQLVNDTTLDPRYQVDDEMRLSEITVPIISNGKVIGIIDSENSAKNFFNEQDLEILETIASMVSVKIDQARSQEKLQRNKEELEDRVMESTHELQLTINELQRSNDTIKKSNLEKEVLLKEVHHRVKNNLQIVSSLLSLHANVSTGEREKEVFRDCQNRIKSMSTIHEQLYNKGAFAEIDMKKYIQDIANQLFLSFDSHGKIEIDFDLDEIHFNMDRSVPFGIILNELIVNSLKHAFPNESGSIKVKLRKSKNYYFFTLEDDGIGFDIEKSTDSMGLDLINTLVSQIDAIYSIESNKEGTICSIQIPISEQN